MLGGLGRVVSGFAAFGRITVEGFSMALGRIGVELLLALTLPLLFSQSLFLFFPLLTFLVQNRGASLAHVLKE